jgi:hypothetical protein
LYDRALTLIINRSYLLVFQIVKWFPSPPGVQ